MKGVTVLVAGSVHGTTGSGPKKRTHTYTQRQNVTDNRHIDAQNQ